MSDLAQVQAQALHDARLRAGRYQRALEAIARGETYGPDAFARFILDGADVADALEADLAVLTEPLPPELAQHAARVLARRELVIAALKWEDADPFDEPALRLVEEGFWSAVAAFRAAGGSEVTG